jgi:hypothetical protein
MACVQDAAAMQALQALRRSHIFTILMVPRNTRVANLWRFATKQ